MRCKCLLLAIGLSLAAHVPALTQEQASAERIGQLIQKLGSPRYVVREKARMDLEKIGEPALPALRQATGHTDMEISEAARGLVRTLEEKQLATKLLAPTKVRLQFKDTPVVEVIHELERQSGYQIQIQSDVGSLARKRITLDTGETTFWRAFDLLCREAGLEDLSTGSNSPNGNMGNYTLPVQRPININPRPIKQPRPLPPRGLKNGAAPKGAGLRGALQVQQPGQVQPPPVAMKAVARVQAVQRWNTLPAQTGTSPQVQISVREGQAKNVPTCVVGAVRIQVPTATVSGHEPQLTLRVLAEPKLKNFFVLGQPTIDSAVDDHGQRLEVKLDAGQGPGDLNPYATNIYAAYHNNLQNAFNQVTVRFKPGAKEPRVLKELTGKLTVQMETPTEPLVVVDNILNAAGTTTKGKDSGSLEVVSVNREGNDSYRLRVRVEMPQGMNPFGMNGNIVINNGGGVVIVRQFGGRGNIVMNGSSSGSDLPMMVDAKGKEPRLVNVPSRSFRGINGKFSEEFILVFQSNPGQGEPTQLRLSGHRTEMINIPFRFENVSLR